MQQERLLPPLLLDLSISNIATVFNYTYAKTIQYKINTKTNLRW